MPRFNTGTIPRDADALVYTPSDALDATNPLWGWYLYRRAAGAAPWVALKLIHPERRAGAANYWLSWNTKKCCFNRSGSTARVPDSMLRAVESIMRELYPTLKTEDMRLPLGIFT